MLRCWAKLRKCAIMRNRPWNDLMTLKWIAQRLRMGTWTHVSNCLGQRRKENEKCK